MGENWQERGADMVRRIAIGVGVAKLAIDIYTASPPQEALDKATREIHKASSQQVVRAQPGHMQQDGTSHSRLITAAPGDVHRTPQSGLATNTGLDPRSVSDSYGLVKESQQTNREQKAERLVEDRKARNRRGHIEPQRDRSSTTDRTSRGRSR